MEGVGVAEPGLVDEDEAPGFPAALGESVVGADGVGVEVEAREVPDVVVVEVVGVIKDKAKEGPDVGVVELVGAVELVDKDEAAGLPAAT